MFTQHLKKSLALLSLSWMLIGFSSNASAHVAYVSLSSGTVQDNFSNWGWYAGTTNTLGNSHELAGGDFYTFTLTTASFVNLTFAADNSNFNYGNYLDPAFSLYSGLLPDDAHDDAPYDPTNPYQIGVGKIASTIDNGVTSPFRDTVHITYDGQFDALHSWSMANEAGAWGLINYITHVGPNNTESVSLNHYYLPAGVYTIAAAGGRSCNAFGCFGADSAYSPDTGIPGILTFSSSAAVPEPEQWALMMLGLALLSKVTRRQIAK